MNNQPDIFNLLHNIVKSMRKMSDKELYAFGITHTEMRILMALHLLYDGECNQEKLVEQLDVDRTNVGRALKKLELMNYIKREKNKNDARTFRVSITEKGMGRKDQLIDFRKKIKTSLIKGLSEQEVKMLSEILLKINNNFCKKVN